MHEMKKHIYKIKLNDILKKINNMKPVDIWKSHNTKGEQNEEKR